jgi:hypothetical protein
MKIKIIKVTLAAIILIKVMACNLSAGSYPYAEIYTLNYPEEKVKNAVAKFKEANPEYIVPKVKINGQGNWELKDEKPNESNNLTMFYFYYAKENQIILTWIRAKGNNKTTFAFVSINDGLNIGNWKEINKDFNSIEDLEEKTKFEKRILRKIEESIVK